MPICLSVYIASSCKSWQTKTRRNLHKGWIKIYNGAWLIHSFPFPVLWYLNKSNFSWNTLEVCKLGKISLLFAVTVTESCKEMTQITRHTRTKDPTYSLWMKKTKNKIWQGCCIFFDYVWFCFKSRDSYKFRRLC